MFQKNPDKLEAKAQQYESRGKTAKAQKYRQKAAVARSKQSGGNLTGTTGSTYGSTTPYFTSSRSPQVYEQNALKWEQKGNYSKAQKNREKVWRLQNPQYPLTTPAPMFYNNNQFLGYNQGLQQGNTFGANRGLNQTGGVSFHNILPAVVETHVHPTIIQQTSRPEKIVEVQPVVHREIDAPSVHIVERHSYEQIPSTNPGVITNQAIVQETVHPRVIEEIQPVVHRDVPAPFIERVEQHVTERVVQPTTMTKDVINDGTRQTGPAIAAGGPIQSGFAGQQGLNQGLSGQQGFNQGLSGQQGLAGQQGFNNQSGLGQQGLSQTGLGSQTSTSTTQSGLGRRI